MGLRRYRQLIWAAAPIFDRTMAYALYWRNQPFVMSSALAHLVDVPSRTDFAHLPAVTTETPAAANRTGQWGRSGDWSCLHLGDIDHAVPTIPDLGELHLYLENLPGKRRLAQACAEPSGLSEARLVCVHDSGEVLPMAPELPQALGYDANDTRWVPGHWAGRNVPPNMIEQGSDVIRTGDGYEIPSRLRWLRINAGNSITVYVVRLVLLDDDDYAHWDVIELEDGIPDSATDALARIDATRRPRFRAAHRR